MHQSAIKKILGLVLTSITSILIAFLIEIASSVIRIFEDLQSSFENYDFTDHYFYSKYTSEPYPRDTNIVFVNIGEYGRSEIAEIITIVNMFDPRVIGLDVRFRSLQNDPSDTLLRNAIIKSKNLVLTKRYDLYTETFVETHPFIRQNVKVGLSNFNIEENFTVRSFYPFFLKDSIVYQHLAVSIVELFHPQKIKKLKKRNKKLEYIYYRYNIDKAGFSGYKYFEYDDLVHPDFYKQELAGKIVIIGFLGDPEFPHSIEAKQYSQLNESPFKRTPKDMYNAVIIGNIISMILDESYIYSYRILDHSLTFFLLLLMCYLFSLMFKNRFYQLWSKLLVFIAILVFWLLSFILFEKFTLKIDLRYFYFFLLFAPDTYEILRRNVFPKIGLVSS